MGKPKLTYANVVATVALVLAAAGGTTALAAAIQRSKTSDINKKGNIRAGRVTSAKLAGIDVVQGSDTGSNFVATCPAGERLLSGGAQVTGSSPGSLTMSAPHGNGWEAHRDGGLGLIVYALCLRATPGS